MAGMRKYRFIPDVSELESRRRYSRARSRVGAVVRETSGRAVSLLGSVPASFRKRALCRVNLVGGNRPTTDAKLAPGRRSSTLARTPVQLGHEMIWVVGLEVPLRLLPPRQCRLVSRQLLVRDLFQEMRNDV